jgi:hypothetical protein
MDQNTASILKTQEEQRNDQTHLLEVRAALAPLLKSGRQLLVDFESVRIEALQLASDASRIQNRSNELDRLINDIMSICSTTPTRLTNAISEAENLTVYDVASPAERSAHIAHISFNLRPGDVVSLVKLRMAQLRDELAGMARDHGPTTVTISAAPVSSQPPRVIVESRYNPLKK